MGKEYKYYEFEYFSQKLLQIWYVPYKLQTNMTLNM
jgi:hypothetical protein